MASNNPNVPAERPAVGRRLGRSDQLRLLQVETGLRGHVDEQAHRARLLLWRERRPEHVRLRSELLDHRDGGSPLRALAASRGCTVQTVLLALFEVQCRGRRSASQPTKIPLRTSREPGQACWEELVAVATVDQWARRGAARPAAENRSEQVRRALVRLETAGRIRASRPTGRGRLEGFSLLHEASDNLGDTATAYSWPDPNRERVVDVPVEFFVNGWVHALNDNEIIAFLFVLDAAQHAGNTDGGVALSTENWARAFGQGRGRRGGLVAQRELQRFGLISVLRPEDRRADGTVEGAGRDGDGADMPWEAHYYWPMAKGLQTRAVPRVLHALGNAHEVDIDVAAMLRHQGDGWTYSAAVAEHEQAALAAPAPSRPS